MNPGEQGYIKKLGQVGGNKILQQQKFTPEAMQLYQQAFGNLGPDSYLSRLAGGDQAIFDQIEAPAKRQFAQAQGSLASRFSGMGSFGARNSSGFQNTANQAASDFAMDLQSKRQELTSNALKELMQMSHTLMNEQPYENLVLEGKPKKKKWWEQLLGAASPLVGAATGFASGGPAGAAKGWEYGNQFSQGFR